MSPKRTAAKLFRLFPKLKQPLALAILVLCFGAAIFWFSAVRSWRPVHEIEPPSIADDTARAEACRYRRALDGRCVAALAETAEPVVAVMIENHPEARPLSGLAQAAVVYEAPVEANITRFLAIYPLNQPVSKAGPVRSARPYYLDWVEEYGQPLYMHVGGSPAALDGVRERGILSINEFYRDWYFWRGRERRAPHNTYTSRDLWERAYNDYGQGAAVLSSSTWQFTDEPACEADCVRTVTASFLPPVYEAIWEYSTTTGRYARYQAGEPHRDEDGTAIMADTVIVERVTKRVLDSTGRLELGTMGGGEALIFRDGRLRAGRWSKTEPGKRTEWLDESGQPIPLRAGVIWVEVVPSDGRVNYE